MGRYGAVRRCRPKIRAIKDKGEFVFENKVEVDVLRPPGRVLRFLRVNYDDLVSAKQ